MMMKVIWVRPVPNISISFFFAVWISVFISNFNGINSSINSKIRQPPKQHQLCYLFFILFFSGFSLTIYWFVITYFLFLFSKSLNCFYIQHSNWITNIKFHINETSVTHLLIAIWVINGCEHGELYDGSSGLLLLKYSSYI